MNYKQLFLCIQCLLAGFVISNASRADWLDSLDKPVEVINGSVTQSAGGGQKIASNYAVLSNKGASQNERVTGQLIEDVVAKCPPFGIDDVWHIRKTGHLSNGMTNISKITDTITSANSQKATLERSGSSEMMRESEYRLSGGKIYLDKYRMQSPMGKVVVDFSNDIPVCPLPEVGQSFKGVGRANGNNIGQITSTIVAINPNFVEVTVPAGTFRTRKIDLKTVMDTHDQGRQVTRETLYFSDGVGVVKEVINFSNNKEVYDLVKYGF
jgi:hypothetical protein